MGTPIAGLRDDFENGTTISTSAWVEAETGSATAAETTGQMRFTLPSSTAGTHTARITSRYAFDITGDGFPINIGTMVSTSVAATAFYQLYLDGGNVLQWVQVSGTLYARSIVATVSTDRYSVAWSGTTYKYLRIRESGGNILWDSSTNGTSWTNRATVAVSALFPVTDLFVDLGATCGNVASPGSFRLDDVNLILPALSTTWRHTRALWALDVVNKRTQVACDTAAGLQGYLVTADGMDVSGEPSGNIRYWSGPAGGGRLLTEQTTQAAAQAMAVNVPTNGTFDLPEQVKARFFRLYHRSVDGTSNTLRELVPRRLVQAEDIEAESIVALNIAAGAITVDKLDVTLTMTGKTIQTAYNGARVVLSGDPFGGFIGYDATDNYNPLTGAGTYQVLWSLADGKFYAGDGNIILDDGGISLIASTAFLSSRSINFLDSTGAAMGSAHSLGVAGAHNIVIDSISRAGENSGIRLEGDAPTGKTATTTIIMQSGAAQSQLVIKADDGGTPTATLAFNGAASFDGGMTSTIEDSATVSAIPALTIGHNSTGTPGVNFGVTALFQAESTTTPDQPVAQITSRWATATHASRKGQMAFIVYDTAQRAVLTLEASGTAPMIGFLGAAAVVRQTVGAAAPAGGTGATAGAYDTAANRNAMITLLNNIRTAGINLGLWAT